MRLQGVPGGLIEAGATHQCPKDIAAALQAVARQVPLEFGHQQFVAPLLRRREVNEDAALDVVCNVTLAPQVARQPMEDHRTDQPVQVTMAPVEALRGGGQPETAGRRDFADNAPVLGGRQMMHFINDQQAKPIEATLR
jgi:hypothetical protein